MSSTPARRPRLLNWQPPSVGDGLRGHDNAMGVIRLLLAGAVILSHAFPLGGWGEDPFLRLTDGQQNLGGVAVLGFFAISGYLIAKSGARVDVVGFLWHRVLRIFPAFIAVLLVGALIVGPLAWLAMGRSFADYLAPSSDGPLGYLIENWTLTIGQYGIRDVFVDTPYGATAGSVLNGSLWTLEHEWFCYLGIAVLVLVGVMSRPLVAQIVVTALAGGVGLIQVGLVFFGVNAGAVVPFLHGSPVRSQLVFAFLVGSTLAVFARRAPLDGRVALAAGAVLVCTLLLGWFGVFGIPALAYLCFYAAARLPAGLRWIGARNDYSYGVYVYGFLVEQILAAFGAYDWGYVPFVALSLVATAACAWLSWHAVERRALAWKDRGPGRGAAYWWARRPGARSPEPDIPEEAT